MLLAMALAKECKPMRTAIKLMLDGTVAKPRFQALATTAAMAVVLLTWSAAWAQPAIGPPAPAGVQILYVLEDIRVEGSPKTSLALIEDMIGLEVGQQIGPLEMKAVRLQMLSSGYFEKVSLSLDKGSAKNHVVLVIEVVERNTIILSDAFLGVSKQHPFWGGLDVVEGNLFGRGLTLGAAFVVGKEQWAVRGALSDPDLMGLPLSTGGSGYWINGREAIFVASQRLLPEGVREPRRLEFERIGGELGVGFYPLALLGVFVDVGFESIDGRSDVPELTQDTYLLQGRSYHGMLRVALDHDTRDNPFLPTQGYRLNLSAQFSSSAVASDYDYARLVLSTSYVKPLGWNDSGHVLRIDLFGGIVLGNPPFYERFYIGDVTALVPSRDLGLNFAGNASIDFLNRGADNLGYEKVVAGGGVEYGVPLMRSPGEIFYRIEFFIGAGLFGMTTPGDLPATRNVNLAVDLVRTEETTVFPIDLTFDLGFRAETPIGIFGLSFANGLALVPF